MKVLMTGATGVIGRRAVPLLVAAGHSVDGVARQPSGADVLERAGARPVRVDLLDAHEVRAALSDVDAVLHFATAIPPLSRAHKARAWETNDRLRSIATGVLVDAAIETGVERVIVESMTFFYADQGDRWIDERSPVDARWRPLRSALTAEQHVRRFVSSGGSGVILRLGQLYGPGAVSGAYLDALRDRSLPSVGRGDNYVSHLHIDDAAAAIVESLAVPSGTYNICGDEPCTAAQSVDALVELLGARRPRRVPRWLARVAAGGSVEVFTRSQRVSNRAFQEVADWRPRYASALDGWPDVVAQFTAPHQAHLARSSPRGTGTERA